MTEERYKLAKFLHQRYEERAKQTGWDTQKSCKVSFNNLPLKNRTTMLLVAQDIIEYFKK